MAGLTQDLTEWTLNSVCASFDRRQKAACLSFDRRQKAVCLSSERRQTAACLSSDRRQTAACLSSDRKHNRTRRLGNLHAPWEHLSTVSLAGLPQARFLSRQRFACFSWQIFCRDKNMFVATNTFLLRETFVVTNIFLPRQMFLSRQTPVLSRQICFFCREKHDENMFVATKLLSWQKSYLWQRGYAAKWTLGSAMPTATRLHVLAASANNREKEEEIF